MPFATWKPLRQVLNFKNNSSKRQHSQGTWDCAQIESSNLVVYNLDSKKYSMILLVQIHAIMKSFLLFSSQINPFGDYKRNSLKLVSSHHESFKLSSFRAFRLRKLIFSDE